MRQRPPIIALAGPDRVGKSTLAEEIAFRVCIAREYAHAPVDGFGRPLREAAHLLCASEQKSEGWREWMREAGERARALHGHDVLMLLLAERFAEEFGEDNWFSRSNHEFLAIIDDLRTANEAEWVHARRGVVVELQRDGVTYSGHSLDSRLHPTLIDAVVPVGDPTETARHILRLTGWLG